MNKQTPPDGWISVAALGRPRGNRGEVTAISLSGQPDRFERLRDVRLLPETGVPTMHEVEEVWNHDGTLIFKFAGVDSISDAERLRGSEVQVPLSERITLDEGEYFQSDLIGCEVRDRASQRLIGHVTGFNELGTSGLLEVNGGHTLIPFVKALCPSIRPQDRVIEVDLPEGLEGLR